MSKSASFISLAPNNRSSHFPAHYHQAQKFNTNDYRIAAGAVPKDSSMLELQAEAPFRTAIKSMNDVVAVWNRPEKSSQKVQGNLADVMLADRLQKSYATHVDGIH